MASTLAAGPVVTAILALLRASVSLTGYVGVRVYPDANGDVPQTPTYPFVSVETHAETPFNTMGGTPSALKWGSEARIVIRVGSQTRSDVQANTITGLVKQALDGQPITVSGYAAASIGFETLTPLKDAVGGITTREWVSTYLVTVHQ